MLNNVAIYQAFVWNEVCMSVCKATLSLLLCVVVSCVCVASEASEKTYNKANIYGDVVVVDVDIGVISVTCGIIDGVGVGIDGVVINIGVDVVVGIIGVC